MRKLGVSILVLLTACATSTDLSGSTTTTSPAASVAAAPEDSPPTRTGDTAPVERFPPAPQVPPGPLDPVTEAALHALLDSVYANDFDHSHLEQVVRGGDPRAAWVLADLLRFFQLGPERDGLVRSFGELTGAGRPPTGTIDFVWAFNNLLAWDLPDWDGYVDLKRRIYTAVDSRWDVFFAEDHGVDWRLVTWGGVLADDRPLGDNGPCRCIPSLDNPETTDADGGDWYDDDGIVFGVVVNGDALALPRHQMEVHEMVNMTLGGRHIAIPYCTLCGSAQAYFTDNVPGVDRVVLRTSGLLSRSNKVMYDLTTQSMFDTFTGEARTGPLGAEGVVLEQTSVVASTWGDWKRAHPETRILAEQGGIGREYLADPLGGRDDDGPIFPVGAVDPRLPVQEPVVGVITDDGRAIAIAAAAAREALGPGGEAEFAGVTIRFTDAIRVYGPDGGELTSHQSFWFAWSQFHPGTLVWNPLAP